MGGLERYLEESLQDANLDEKLNTLPRLADRVPIGIHFGDIPVDAIVETNEGGQLNSFVYRPVFTDLLAKVMYGTLKYKDRNGDVISTIQEYQKRWGRLIPLKVNHVDPKVQPLRESRLDKLKSCCAPAMEKWDLGDIDTPDWEGDDGYKIAYLSRLGSAVCDMTTNVSPCYHISGFNWVLDPDSKLSTSGNGDKTGFDILIYVGGKDQLLSDCLSTLDHILHRYLHLQVNDLLSKIPRNKKIDKLSVEFPFDLLVLDPPGEGHGQGSCVVGPHHCVNYVIGSLYQALGAAQRHRSCNVPLKVFIVGFSIGASIAVSVAEKLSQHDGINIAHLYLIAPFTRTEDIISEAVSRPLGNIISSFVKSWISKSTKWNNINAVKKIAKRPDTVLPAMSIITGKHDSICPPCMGKAIYQSAKDEGLEARLVELEGDHTSVVASSAIDIALTLYSQSEEFIKLRSQSEELRKDRKKKKI